MNEAYYQPAIVFLCGCILFVLYRGRRMRKDNILKDYNEATGVVTQLETSFIGDDSFGIYYPIIEFESKDGQHISSRYNEGYNPSRYKVNEQVIIQYSKHDPQEFIIKDNRADWIGIGLLVSGLAAIAQSLFSLYQILLIK